MSRWAGVGSPGLLGDLLAVLSCELAAAVALVVIQRAVEGLPLSLVVALLYTGVVVTPLALTGVLLLEWALRGVRAQWVHILGAGLLALAAGLPLAHLLRGVDGLHGLAPVACAAALGAALGRALVAPLVPVDDDFAGTSARW